MTNGGITGPASPDGPEGSREPTAALDPDATVTFDAVGHPRRGQWEVTTAGSTAATAGSTAADASSTAPDAGSEDVDAIDTVVLGRAALDGQDDAPTALPAAHTSEAAAQASAAADDAPGAAPAVVTAGAGDSVGRNSVLMAAGSLASRLLGMVRGFLLAAIVAVSGVADAFQVANTMPNQVFNLLNAGVLNAVLIPQITAAMKHDDGGQDYVDRLLTAAFAAILGLSAISLVLTPQLVHWTSDMNPALTHLAILFGFICMPQICFYGLYAVLGNVLNARGQFAAFMWSPALSNLVQIAGMVAFLVQWGQQTDPAHWTTAMVWTLAGSFTLGIVVQALVLLVPLVRGGFRYRPRWGLRGRGFGQASRMLGWTMTALVFQQFGGFFVQWVLTSVVHRDAGVGGLMAYSNALLIFFLPHGLITVSILTALFPQMSRLAQDGDVTGLRRLVTRALSQPAVAIIPASAVMFVLATPIVKVMLGLDPHGTAQVAQALRIMSIGTLPFGLVVLQQRYSFARQDGRQNLGFQVFLTVVQVCFSLTALLLVPSRWALATIAWGLVVGNGAASLVFIAVARRELGGLAFGKVLRLWVRLLIASVLAAATGWLVVYGMRAFGAGWTLSAATCALTGVSFALVFLACSRILHIREVDDLLAPLLRRLHLAR